MSLTYYECPECGEITEHKPKYYPDGSVTYVHEQRMVFDGPTPHLLISKSCTLQNFHTRKGRGLTKEDAANFLGRSS